MTTKQADIRTVQQGTSGEEGLEAARSTESAQPARNPKAVLFVAAFAAFLATFNETFLNVGFAPIMESLAVDVGTVQWLATAYMLGAAVMVPISAFAYRSFPTRLLFCFTTALLVAGSIIGVLAPNFAMLLVGRIVQALGTGMLIPVGMNITLEIAPREKLGVVVNMLSLLTIFAMNIIVPTFMQSVLGTPPLVASLTLFPAILCSCVVSPLTGRIYDRRGPGVLLPAGFACITVFSVLTGIFIATASPVVLAIVYIPVICGSALVIGPVQSFALFKLTYEQNPHGVTIMSTGFQIAGCVGSSVFTGVYAATCAASMAAGADFAIAATQGMTTTGILVGIVGAVGFACALAIRHMAAHSEGKGESEGASWEQGETRIDAAASGIKENRATLASIMKADVYTLSVSASVAEAMELFVSKGISGAPVVGSEGRLAGFISDGDVMRSLADQIPAFKSAWSFIVEPDNADFERTLSEVMSAPIERIATRKVITVNMNDDMGTVTRTLADNHLKKAPVMNDGKMVGIINRSNITAYAVSEFLGLE